MNFEKEELVFAGYGEDDVPIYYTVTQMETMGYVKVGERWVYKYEQQEDWDL